MQTPQEIVSSLQRRGVKLWTQDGQLRFHALKGSLSAEDMQKLRASKAELVGLLQALQTSTGTPVSGAVGARQAPLTAMQRQWWRFITDQQHGRTERLCYVATRIRGTLVLECLRRSLDLVVQRHESLRTRIVSADGQLRQQIDAVCACSLVVVDLARLPAGEPERAARQLAHRFVAEKITLDRGPLFAAELLRLSEREHVLILALEHAITDGASNAILCRDIWGVYEQLVRGRSPSLPALPLQFADYAIWQEQNYDEWSEQHEEYWRIRLAGTPCTRLPIQENEPAGQAPRYITERIGLGRELSDRLRELARRERTLPAMVGLAIYVTAIHRWSRKSDLLVLFVSNGRFRPELHEVIGFLTGHVHLRLTVSERETFASLLQQLDRELTSAYEHYDFDRVPELFPGCGTELYFNWESVTPIAEAIRFAELELGTLALEDFALDAPWSRKFLPLFYDTPAGIVLELTYRSDSIQQTTIREFRDQLCRAARELADGLDWRVTQP